jgi:hypothetical protein
MQLFAEQVQLLSRDIKSTYGQLQITLGIPVIQTKYSTWDMPMAV